VPVKSGDVNRNWVVDKMLNKFVFGNANKPGVYFDEENRRHLNTLRMQYSMAALSLADNNRKGDAIKLLQRCDKMMLQENFPYGMVSRDQRHNQISGQFLLAAYKAGDSVLAKKVYASLRKDLEQELAYFDALPESKQVTLLSDNQRTMQLLQQLQQMQQYFNNPVPVVNPETRGPVINNVPKDTNKADAINPKTK